MSVPQVPTPRILPVSPLNVNIPLTYDRPTYHALLALSSRLKREQVKLLIFTLEIESKMPDIYGPNGRSHLYDMYQKLIDQIDECLKWLSLPFSLKYFS
jgi:hypothetical protein